MDWLYKLTQQTAVIVPTRSLANSLQEQVATYHIAQQKSVWETPNILVWQDYCQQLWQANKHHFEQAYTVITPQQSLLLWHRVIDASRRQENQFTLLDVQQTSKAIQTSWRLMHDWRLSADTIKLDHATDTQQFIIWIEAYQALLSKYQYLDGALLADKLLSIDSHIPFDQIIWYAYDLKTGQQQQFDFNAETQGVVVRDMATAPQNKAKNVCDYVKYQTKSQELHSVLVSIRSLIETNPKLRINLVVPDLQRNYTQVNNLAKQVFYPAQTPLAVQSTDKVYRFSLGEPLQQWPAIDVALRLLKLLKNHFSLNDISVLLRSEYLVAYKQHTLPCVYFLRWLQCQRVSNLSLPQLASQLELYQQKHSNVDMTELLSLFNGAIEQQLQLQQTLSQMQYAVMSFVEWVDVFADWLALWGWATAPSFQELDSVQFQLRERWDKLLDEYRALGLVQQKVGLNRALDILMQMTHDSVFLPKAAASPLLISGIYEAIGQTADRCFVVGMDDSYPLPVKADAFIPNRLLLAQGYPEANNVSSFEQAQRVIQSLLNGAPNTQLSYAALADQDQQIESDSSPIFRQKAFLDCELNSSEQFDKPSVKLEQYQDTEGPSWGSAKQVTGGAKIFEDQSNCAFKAFMSHQLKFDQHDETEFGLDALDRGNIAHGLLQRAWQNLQTQTELTKMDDIALRQFCEKTVTQVLIENPQELNEYKLRLLHYEQKRLSLLLEEWLAVDAQRPTAFAVVETEERRDGEYGGIHFQYIIDRLDALDDGRTVIIDYKTGLAQRNDWLDSRIKKPQLPLYSLALQAVKQKPVSGIAYAKLKRHECDYINLSEASIFKRTSAEAKYEQAWHDSKQQWPAIFQQLANDFLSGKANVNPVNKATCDYCELQAVCRVAQLRHQTVDQIDDK